MVAYYIEEEHSVVEFYCLLRIAVLNRRRIAYLYHKFEFLGEVIVI